MKFAGADIALLVLIGVSTLIGLFRGLFREAFSLAVWGGSLAIAYLLAPALRPLLAQALGNDAAAYPLALLAVFAACMMVGALLQRLGAGLIDRTGLTGVDRLLGVAFGAARGAVVAVVLLIALRPFLAAAVWWQESVTISVLLSFEHAVLGALQGFAGHIAGRMQ